MLVTIVAVPNADNTGLDPDRVEKVEDLHPDVARPMLDLGTARLPSDNELAAYREGQTGSRQTQNEQPTRAPKTGSVTTDLRTSTEPTETPAA